MAFHVCETGSLHVQNGGLHVQNGSSRVRNVISRAQIGSFRAAEARLKMVRRSLRQEALA
jgi:hypothetical protein